MISKLPSWFKQEIPQDLALSRMRLLSEFKVNTVCKHANCPNLSYCFRNCRLTFMILGDICTRNCRFCAVKKSSTKPLTLDLDEPQRIAEVVKELGLNYVVITAVTRDDLEDGGAGIFAKTVELIHSLDRNIKVEVLIPDFLGNLNSLKTLVDASPSVVAHNIETVRRLYMELRPQANYALSLEVLHKIKELKPSLITKSSLMLGLGEQDLEVIETMNDLRHANCDILTLGQYLAPSINHYPIKEFIDIEGFEKYRQIAMALGFKAVVSGPLVRSSYRAEEVFSEVANV